MQEKLHYRDRGTCQTKQWLAGSWTSCRLGEQPQLSFPLKSLPTAPPNSGQCSPLTPTEAKRSLSRQLQRNSARCQGQLWPTTVPHSKGAFKLVPNTAPVHTWFPQFTQYSLAAKQHWRRPWERQQNLFLCSSKHLFWQGWGLGLIGFFVGLFCLFSF